MAVTIFGGDLRTGEIKIRNIAAKSGSVTTTLSRAGTISCSVGLPMRSPLTGVDVDVYNTLLPGKSFLAWEENGVILNAGPIWKASYALDSRALSLSAAGIRSYWQYRFVLPALAAGALPAGHDTNLSGVHLRTIAKRLVQQAQSWTRGSVPIVFEADIPGDAVRNYEGHELHIVDEKLQQISQVIGGPDIMFNPRYTSAARTHIEWVMETGNPMIARATKQKWDASGLPNPSVRGASIDRDATRLTTDNYQTGSTGEEGDSQYPLMARASDNFLTDLGFPMIESSSDRTSVINLPVLQDHADQAVIVGRDYLSTWKFDAKKDATPKIGEYGVGDFGAITTTNDPILGTKDHQVRVLEITSTLGDGFAKITAAPRRESV